MSIATKLFSIVVAMMALVLCVGGVGLYVAKVNYDSLATVYRDRVECLEQLHSVSNMANRVVEATDKPLDVTSDWKQARYDVALAQKVIQKKWQDYLTTYLDPREARLVEETKPLMVRVDSSITSLQEILQKEDSRALHSIGHRDLYPAIEQLTAKINTLIDIQVVISKENLTHSSYYYRTGRTLSLLITIIGLIGSGLVSILIIKKLLGDLGGEPEYVRDIALAVASGNLMVPVNVDAKKRGSVLWAMGEMVSQLNRVMAEKEMAVLELKTLTGELEVKVAERAAELREKDELLLVQGRQAAMGEMIANIAHQWRQPLNSLALIIQELSYSSDKNQLTRENVKLCTAKSMGLIQHMSKTMDNFRDFFKPDIAKSRFNVSDVISSCITIVEDRINSLNVELTLSIVSDSVVNGYQNNFAQVILNIINNACDALVERKVKEPKISITVSGDQDKSTVAISDNAGGVPPEVIDKVFDPYFTTKGSQQGTGIGLFMAKTIVEKNMGGKLTVNNNADGAEFRIEIPHDRY
jgi:signal transduction histidine kinase